MATNKTYPCLTAAEAAVLILNGAMVAVSGQGGAASRIDQLRFSAPQNWEGQRASRAQNRSASVAGRIQEIRMRLPPVLRSSGYVTAIIDGNNPLDFKRGKFYDLVVEGLR